ncbi:MAG: energy transducer TonB [Burkholderiales bacterium]
MQTKRKHTIKAAAAILLGAIAAACTTVETPAPRHVAVAPPPPPPVAKRAPGPNYHSMDQYEVAVAKRIFDANPDKTIKGDLQPLLRAIVILQFDVDATGKVHNVRTWRSPEHAADQIARATLHRAGNLPPPPSSWLQGGKVEVTETWLINREGHFHLRALKPRQL